MCSLVNSDAWLWQVLKGWTAVTEILEVYKYSLSNSYLYNSFMYMKIDFTDSIKTINLDIEENHIFTCDYARGVHC